jgi:RNAse (barnase) inhibitor barstar
MSNIKIIASDVLPEMLLNYKTISIDGTKTLKIKDFYTQIAIGLDFPEYFDHNLDSLDECLNDLEWLDEPNIVIQIQNFELFLTAERGDKKLIELLNLLDATAEDWKWLDDESERKNMAIVVNSCPRVFAVFDQESIMYDLV